MSHYFDLFLIITLSTFVDCKSCVVYNFERDFENLFTNNSTLCSNFQPWEVGNYTDIDFERPHEGSKKFIYPNTALSCVTSFAFPMEINGVIEVKLYIESKSPNDFVSIIVNAINPSGIDTAVANYVYNSGQADFSDGWHVLRMTTIGAGSFDGYVSLLHLLYLKVLNDVLFCTVCCISLISHRSK